MLKIAICDDDIIITERINQLIEDICKKRHIETDIEIYYDGLNLYEALKKGIRYNLIYLDIKMKNMNGIDTAKYLREFDSDALLIYVSSYENYLIELFEVEPFRFIKKPINNLQFEQYFIKALDRIKEEDIYFTYKFNRMFENVLIREIKYFESSGRTIIIKTKDKEQKFYSKLNTIEKNLQNNKIKFLRIHQSYLVNFKYIDKMGYNKVVLIDGTELQISEDRQKLIRNQYMDFIGGCFVEQL